MKWNIVVVQLPSHVNSLRAHGLQCTSPPCPSASPGVCPSSCPLNWWCHPTVSLSVTPFFCPQSFSASGSFPVCQLFASGDQSSGASASVLPISIQCWFSFGLTGLISLVSRGLSQEKSISSLVLCLLYGPAVTFVHDYWKDHSLDYMDLCRQSGIFAF